MNDISAKQLRDEIAAGQVKSVEAVEAVFAVIEKNDPVIGAYISTFKDQALAQAGVVDKKIASGEKVGALAGVPIAIKDNMCTTFGATSR